MDPAVLKKRVETALREGRKQQAVDFARTLFECAPQPAHRALLVRATLDEAERLLATNQPVQAGSVASRTWALVESGAEKERLAEILARSGNLGRAWLLAEQLAHPALSSRILGYAADAAICNRPTFSSGSAVDFNAHKEAIVRAFAEVHAGHDEQARAALQVIGLTSPFLEWKVLLRGLLAYYQGDDAKALENWQRLDPRRVPAQLAAPFRVGIDPAFHAAQSLEVRGHLQEALDRVLGGGLVARLRTVQRHLADERQLPQAFRQVQQLLPRLQDGAPRLVPRLAACFFWAIVDHGYPEDLQRYLQVFAAPAEDPELDRLEALALERRHQLADAHAAWQSYEQSLARRATALPPGHANGMRALVWRHMGENAGRMPDEKLRRRLQDLPFGDFDRLPRALKPNAETCFKRSLELAPDQVEAHDLLMRHYLDARRPGKAIQAGKQLLKKFPDHVPTLELIGDLCLKKENYPEAVDYFTRAVQANPLDGRLRVKLSIAHAACAEKQAALRQFDKARDAFQAALTLREGSNRFPILCQWASCEFLADNASRAEELLAQALGEQSHRLAIAFAMLVHAIKLKLGKALKARFDREFKELLRQPLDVAAAAALAAQAATLRRAGVPYVGQKTHEKKVIAYVDKAKHAELSEAQLQQICDALTDLNTPKQLRSFFARGQQRFPSNPRFYLAEIDHELSRPAYRVWPARVSRLLEKVRELASALPTGEREAVFKLVQEREEKFMAVNPFGGLFGMPNLDDFLDDDEFDDDDYGDDEDGWEDI